jgi:hypothetical protein
MNQLNALHGDIEVDTSVTIDAWPIEVDPSEVRAGTPEHCRECAGRHAAWRQADTGGLQP